MRICHVSPHLPPDQAANALLPAELAAWARKQGHDVTLIAHEPVQGRVAASADLGRVVRLPRKPATQGLAKLLRVATLQQARKIRVALDQSARGSDLVHLHSNGLLIEVAAAWARTRGIPYLLTLYGTEIWHYRRRWPIDPFTRAYRRAGTVTFYSRKLLERSTELGLTHPDRVVVYPAIGPAFAPCDEQARARLRASLGIAEAHVVLNVKRLHELAGQQFLIDAFARVARERRDVRLVICGTGPLRESLQARVRDRGLTSRVTFTGLISNDEVARFAAVADVFALPSLLEALPTVAVEALASGTPVLSADHPGGLELHEIFGDDVEIVPKSDVDRLAAALGMFLASPRRVRRETLDLVRTHFSLDAVMRNYDTLYQRVAARKSTPAAPHNPAEL